MKKTKAVMVWSGGKDSSMALHEILEAGQYDVVALLCTIQEQNQRVSMHGVHRSIIEAQANSIGIPVVFIPIPDKGQEPYDRAMRKGLQDFLSQGVLHFIFGDIFLEDLREYREKKLAEVGAKAVFPLWKRDTKILMDSFIAKGFKTICCCISKNHLKDEFLGKTIDEKWVHGLPEGVDPCGENGEFHTCSFDGPIYKEPLSLDCKGVTVKAYDYEGKTYEYGFVDIELSGSKPYV